MDPNETDSLIPNNSTGTSNRDQTYQSTEMSKLNQTVVYCIHGLNSQQCCQVTCTRDGRDSKFELPHCHFYDEERSRIDKQARYRLILASVLCLVFMVIEVIGGLLANSLAIASDAAHLLTDFASFMISLFSIYMASRPATKNMSFGWHRAEVIGALTSILMIWVVTGILCYMAAERIIQNEFEIQSEIMVITAALGVVINLIMGCSLTCGGVPHSHGHAADHADHTVHHGEHQGKGNINVRAAFVHVLGDFFQSLGVLIASLVIYFFPDYRIIDPICTFLFSIIVLITTITILRDVLNVLMEGIPKGINIREVQKTLANIEGVRKVHNLRIWSLSMDKAALSTHLAIDQGLDSTGILNAALREIKSRFDIYELTIQIEEYRDEMKDCQQCQISP